MKKRVLMVSLSIVMVLGLAGIVNATTIGKNTTDMQPKASNAQAYMDNNDITSTEVEQVETTQPDQTVPSKTDVYDQMRSSNVSMNDQMQNMPMNTQMNDQMINSQHTQGMAGTNKPNNSNASQQPAQKSSGNNMMGSMGSMGR
ncbi:hypothetical protein [Desulfosporosinus sp. BICA1-9]|uniref:hypothetical protein n=1 Tax=Desulfosporosinus sp. BICA1-9 TaxID=1531958 RepID=UPI00054B5631|nr:hypothetical protein [Desulfosporosinus sp. BICA1-9]KJS49576.1 MAG: hypothetical protein VR66_07765 [Peptococcaceae bacterium BRH_c23]KJS84125.1 MAG: hypothetical protein JL57_21275 [Desulfosporosinus sp. BICA1-9]KJS87149.1 MAG: hypothetical protein JL57_14795 [Desulfosporosinus sp. BICA1-9]